MKKSFPLPLRGQYISKGQWGLTTPFEYRSKKYRIIRVPVGFLTDGASIPSFAQSLIGSPWGGKYARIAVIHDFLYKTHKVSRIIADRIFAEGMKIMGVSWWRRILMYQAVRRFGWMVWNKKK